MRAALYLGLILGGCAITFPPDFCGLPPKPQRPVQPPRQGAYGVLAGPQPLDDFDSFGMCPAQPPPLPARTVCARPAGSGMPRCTTSDRFGGWSLELPYGQWRICLDEDTCSPEFLVDGVRVRLVDWCSCVWTLDTPALNCFGMGDCPCTLIPPADDLPACDWAVDSGAPTP